MLHQYDHVVHETTPTFRDRVWCQLSVYGPVLSGGWGLQLARDVCFTTYCLSVQLGIRVQPIDLALNIYGPVERGPAVELVDRDTTEFSAMPAVDLFWQSLRGFRMQS